jgi:hypothetical protein
MLIDIQQIKTAFPGWETYCTPDDFAASAEERLLDAARMAELELADYVAVDAVDPAQPLFRHLVNLIRKHAFDLKHAEAVFEFKPQILRDYEATVRALTRLRDEPRGIKIRSKGRRFDTWFRR